MIRRGLDISGIVQGVGFRPHVYRLAHRYELAGHVGNTRAGVHLEVEADQDSLDAFVAELFATLPEAARVDQVSQTSLPVVGERSFLIIGSTNDQPGQVSMPVDRAPCCRCVEELFNPNNRRFRRRGS